MIRLKRAYDEPAPSDGERILVERLWPRGVTKARAAVDLWLKEVAPSAELRKWFGHDPARWKQFERRYWKELHANEAVVDVLRRCRDLEITPGGGGSITTIHDLSSEHTANHLRSNVAEFGMGDHDFAYWTTAAADQDVVL